MLLVQFVHQIFEVSEAVRMRDMQHFKENAQVGDNALHVDIVRGGKELLRDPFQNEESLLIGKPLLKDECCNQMHALAVPHIRVVNGKDVEEFLSAGFDFRGGMGAVDVLLDDVLEICGQA